VAAPLVAAIDLIDRAVRERHDVEVAVRAGLDVRADAEVATEEQGLALGDLPLVDVVGDAVLQPTTWRSGTAVTQRSPTGIADTRVATAPDHVGVAVLRAGNPVGEIRVAAVGPDAPVNAAPAPIPTPQPPPVVKRKPSITGTGSAKRVRSKVRLKISAKLVLPSGVSGAAGCNGTVKVSVARRKKVIASKTVKVRSTCKFGLKTKLKRSKVKRAKRLSVIFRFRGNDVLTPVKRTGSIKVK
jgi:hypothetical protein